jgi:uncharacterized membrane protein
MPRKDEPPQVVRELVAHNIRALLDARHKLERPETLDQAIADRIVDFCGTMGFVYFQTAAIAAWVVLNLGLVPFVRPFDRPPFPVLTMFLSVEAVLLAAFVLVGQRRRAAVSDRRADLDVQITLLSEHKTTHVVELLHAIAERVGAPTDVIAKHELREDVAAEHVLDQIEELEERQLEEDRDDGR